jgi:hypothetical protein
MEFVFAKLDITPPGYITGEGRLEGGDFIAYSKDLCFVGVFYIYIYIYLYIFI